MRADGTKEIGPINIPHSDFAGLDGFEIASNGDEFLVGWTSFDRIEATRISASGAVLGTQSLQNTGNWITQSTQVAHNGDSYLVVWGKYEDGGIKTFARRVSDAGMPQGAPMLVTPEDAVPIDILLDGPDFLVLYSGGDGLPDGRTDTLMQRVDASGELVGEPEVIFSGPRWEHYGSRSFATGPAGTALMTFSFWADDPYNGARAYGGLFRTGDACPPDFNGDGTVNTQDVLAFLNAWTAGDSRADFNGDGDINTLDVLAFLNAWSAGC
jgi:hypothetical protein